MTAREIRAGNVVTSRRPAVASTG